MSPSPYHSHIPYKLCAAILLLAITHAVQSNPLVAGPTNAAAPPAAAATSTNLNIKPEAGLHVQPPFIEPPTPQSLFAMPKGPADGKDPFFPKSTAPYDGGNPIPVKKTGPVPIVAELILRGISGSDEKPLAIINTTTFGVDDDLDVTTKAGKLRVRCLEINKAAGTALVQLGGEKRLLRLPTATLPTPK